MSRLQDALRARFSSPAAVLRRLGLDERLADPAALAAETDEAEDEMSAALIEELTTLAGKMSEDEWMQLRLAMLRRKVGERSVEDTRGRRRAKDAIPPRDPLPRFGGRFGMDAARRDTALKYAPGLARIVRTDP